MVARSKKSYSARERFAANMYRFRKEQGLTQEELGELAQLDRTYIGSVERGERNISIDNMEAVANALGVDLRELLAD